MSTVSLTSDPKRIEQAHYLLQRLEDHVVGCMAEGTPEQYRSRLASIHDDVWAVIRQLNEAYDNKCSPQTIVVPTANRGPL